MNWRTCFCFLALFALSACGDTNVAETKECTPGVSRCTDDGSVETCNDTGQFMFSEQCGVDDVCSAGECIEKQGPCEARTDNCDANATCVPIDTSGYTCTCNEGFEGNGKTCTAVGACTTNDECTSISNNACVVTLCDNGTCKETIKEDPACCDPALDVPCGGMGDPCTTDACVDFNCILTAVENCCTEDTDCVPKDCQTLVGCDANNTCVYNSDCCAADSECDDDDVCTTDTCEEQDCVVTPVDGCCNSAEDCSSFDPCTGFDCANNECIPNSIANCCNPEKDVIKLMCSDSTECTADSCVNNVCVHDDSNCCTDKAGCEPGTCEGATCTNGQCFFTSLANGTPCGGIKKCNNGKCEVPTADPKDPSSPSS
jgi:hypothetical protein